VDTLTIGRCDGERQPNVGGSISDLPGGTAAGRSRAGQILVHRRGVGAWASWFRLTPRP